MNTWISKEEGGATPLSVLKSGEPADFIPAILARRRIRSSRSCGLLG